MQRTDRDAQGVSFSHSHQFIILDLSWIIVGGGVLQGSGQTVAATGNGLNEYEYEYERGSNP